MSEYKYTTPEIPNELKTPQTEREKAYLNLLLNFAEKVKRDYMTGFLHREEFRSQTKNGDKGIYIFIDGDGLKQVNDVTRSHEAGNAAIEALVEGIKNAVRQDHVASRPGGDEFIIFIKNVDLKTGETIAHRILESIRKQKIKYNGSNQKIKEILENWPVTASIGVGYTEEEADQAMYTAKHSGRNRVEVFKGEMKAAKVLHRIKLVRRAISKI